MADEFDAPQSRNEAILQNMLGANNALLPPFSRIELLLLALLGKLANIEANTVTKQYVDDADALKVDKVTPSIQGMLTWRTNREAPAENYFIYAEVLENGLVFFGTGHHGDIEIGGVAAPRHGNSAINRDYLDSKVGTQTEISDANPVITPTASTIYQCGTLASLTITNPTATGAWSVIFTSGSTATVVSGLSGVLGLESFTAEANTIYEINVLDNRAVVGSWAVASS